MKKIKVEILGNFINLENLTIMGKPANKKILDNMKINYWEMENWVMDNNKENRDLMKEKEVSCCYSEINEKGQHITNCTNLPTKLAECNVQIRYFCNEHMIWVDNIRRKMAEKYIKEYETKLIKWIDNKIEWISTAFEDTDVDKEILKDVISEFRELKNTVQNGDFR